MAVQAKFGNFYLNQSKDVAQQEFPADAQTARAVEIRRYATKPIILGGNQS